MFGRLQKVIITWHARETWEGDWNFIAYQAEAHNQKRAITDL